MFLLTRFAINLEFRQYRSCSLNFVNTDGERIADFDMQMRNPESQFLSTAQAAEILGLSTTLVQSLVDRNELSGWKTRGGHRRICRQSILDYQSHAQTGRVSAGQIRNQPIIMVAVETQEQYEDLKKESQSWRFPFKVELADSITAVLLDLPNVRPDMLIVELAMPRNQQEKTLSALQDFNARGRPISMALVTQEDGLLEKMPAGNSAIQLVPGPMTPIWLHAFLTGVQASWRT